MLQNGFIEFTAATGLSTVISSLSSFFSSVYLREDTFFSSVVSLFFNLSFYSSLLDPWEDKQELLDPLDPVHDESFESITGGSEFADVVQSLPDLCTMS